MKGWGNYYWRWCILIAIGHPSVCRACLWRPAITDPGDRMSAISGLHRGDMDLLKMIRIPFEHALWRGNIHLTP